MQQACSENKLIFGETKLQTNTLVWTIDITYFQLSCPEYGETCIQKKVNNIILFYNICL